MNAANQLNTTLQTDDTNQQTQQGCEICGSTQRRLLFRGPDRLMQLPGLFSIVRCEACGLLYQHPQLTWQELEPYYEGDYTAFAPIVQDERSTLRRWIKRVGVLKQRHYVERFCREGTLLDIGCGTGLFLAEMQTTGRWQLAGVEPMPEAAHYVQNRLGIPVVREVFEEASLPKESQDVVTMWHVLEHVASPSLTLDKVWQLLKPGGYFIFSIPNYESLGRRVFGRYWVGWDQPRHLFVFPRQTLITMLERHGFEVVDKRCFLITYHSLGHSLSFWLQSWPAMLQPLAQLLRQAYYTPITRLAVFPLQVLVEQLGLATVMTWTVRKVQKSDSNVSIGN